MMNIYFTWCFCLAQSHETRERPCPRPKLIMIQTKQQAIKQNKSSARYLSSQTKNQISTLRINHDWHIDMPLVEPNWPSTRHYYFSQTRKLCFIPANIEQLFNQSKGRPAFALDENQSVNQHFLANIILSSCFEWVL